MKTLIIAIMCAFLGATAAAARPAQVSDLTPTLRDKVKEILRDCKHAHLNSAYRPGARVHGSGRASLHSVYPARAADIEGDYRCAYAHLKHWPGGYSLDPGAVRHIHISYSPPRSGRLAGREWHARFYHYASHRRHHRQYARAYAVRL